MSRKPFDVVPLTPEQQQLAVDNVGLVFHWALYCKKRYPGIDPDDLTGTGFVALCRATQLFDKSKGKKFVSYASRAIINAMIRHISDNRWLVHVPTAMSKIVWKHLSESEYLPSQESLGMSDGRYASYRAAWMIRRTELRVRRNDRAVYRGQLRRRVSGRTDGG